MHTKKAEYADVSHRLTYILAALAGHADNVDNKQYNGD